MHFPLLFINNAICLHTNIYLEWVENRISFLNVYQNSYLAVVVVHTAFLSLQQLITLRMHVVVFVRFCFTPAKHFPQNNTNPHGMATLAVSRKKY